MGDTDQRICPPEARRTDVTPRIQGARGMDECRPVSGGRQASSRLGERQRASTDFTICLFPRFGVLQCQRGNSDLFSNSWLPALVVRESYFMVFIRCPDDEPGWRTAGHRMPNNCCWTEKIVSKRAVSIGIFGMRDAGGRDEQRSVEGRAVYGAAVTRHADQSVAEHDQRCRVCSLRKAAGHYSWRM